MIRSSVAVFIVGLAFAGTAFAHDAPAKKTAGMMTHSARMTLYTFDKDSAGKSNGIWRVVKD